jgi:hypothetical protein
MCQCGTQQPTPPNSGNGNQPASTGVQVCTGFQSSILLIDEIGLPMQGTSVDISIGGAAAQNFTTDSHGRVCFHHPPGTAVVVQVAETHETRPGQSTTTPSGRHFGHLLPGP